MYTFFKKRRKLRHTRKYNNFKVCCKFSRNQTTGLYFYDFAMIPTCTYLFSKTSGPHRRRSLINQQMLSMN